MSRLFYKDYFIKILLKYYLCSIEKHIKQQHKMTPNEEADFFKTGLAIKVIF
jgi:hypothetical protein